MHDYYHCVMTLAIIISINYDTDSLAIVIVS